MLLTTFLVFSLIVSTQVQQTIAYIYAEWVTLDYNWPNVTMKNRYIQNGLFKPELNQPSGITSYSVGDWADRLFVTVPRMRGVKGVPAGLNKVVNGPDGKKILDPYPSWEKNTLDSCDNLIFPMSTKMDPNTAHLYVIDVGRVGISGAQPANLCPAKLVVLDTTSSYGDVVRSYEFPDSVVSRNSNFLNDLVLDMVDPAGSYEVRYVYITDTAGQKIVTFDLRTNQSWSFSHLESMKADEDSNMTINGENYTFDYGVNGIAISPTFNYVYYSALGSRKLWQVPTWVLRKNGSDFGKYTRLVGKKVSISDGMVMGRKYLYYGAITKDAVYKWDIKKDITDQSTDEGSVKIKTQIPLEQNWETVQWADGFSIDSSHNLFFITERAQLFHTGTMDFTGKQGANFRIFKHPISDDENNLKKTAGSSVLIG